ncbi:hypothetical protein NDU88_002020 [Pleurodeles waltl]|uniref:Uncharacterized protein n=1 Tax=Pleurodeles waltl TaxID=8319 RepID=A0AAV7W233_PLEWA|nr:hypothetical protein NDU88_002020 [Pleurodeles waltl]
MTRPRKDEKTGKKAENQGKREGALGALTQGTRRKRGQQAAITIAVTALWALTRDTRRKRGQQADKEQQRQYGESSGQGSKAAGKGR